MTGGSRTTPRWALLTLITLIGATSACGKATSTATSSATSTVVSQTSVVAMSSSETGLGDSSSPTSSTEVTIPVTTPPVVTTVTDSGGVSTAPTENRNGYTVIKADGVARAINTTCFTTTDLVIPAGWELLVSPEGCSFAFEGPSPENAVIAGELSQTPPAQSFDELVSSVKAGNEPDIVTLGPTNDPISQGPLTVMDSWEGDTPQHWMIVQHTSNRRSAGNTYTAIVEVPPSDESQSYTMVIWATIPAADSQFFFEFVEGLTAF